MFAFPTVLPLTNVTRCRAPFAQRAFPSQRPILETSLLQRPQDIQLQRLKDLRSQQLAATIVECTFLANCPDDRLQAESTSREALKYRAMVSAGWSVLTTLHKVVCGLAKIPDDGLPFSTEFRIESQVEGAVVLSATQSNILHPHNTFPCS